MTTAPGTSRPELRLLLWLLGGGAVLGVVRMALLNGGLTKSGTTGGIADLIGCAAGAASLYAVLSLQTLANTGFTTREFDDGVASVALATWLFALVPPMTPPGVIAGTGIDFAFAYLPVSLLGVVVVRVLRLFWQADDRLGLALRHVTCLAAMCPSVGVALQVGAAPEQAAATWPSAVWGAVACGVAAISLGVLRRRH